MSERDISRPGTWTRLLAQVPVLFTTQLRRRSLYSKGTTETQNHKDTETGVRLLRLGSRVHLMRTCSSRNRKCDSKNLKWRSESAIRSCCHAASLARKTQIKH